MKFDILVYFEILLIKFKFHLTLTRITSSLLENQCTFMIICRWSSIRMRNVSDTTCRANRNTYFCVQYLFFLKSCCIWDNVEKYGRARQATDYNIMQRMSIASCVTKATHTHTHALCNTHFFPTATMVARTGLSVTFHAHCLSSLGTVQPALCSVQQIGVHHACLLRLGSQILLWLQHVPNREHCLYHKDQ
jgi:hypothetical protein